MPLVRSSPIAREHRIKDGKVRVMFDHVGRGLKVMNGGDPRGFTIAGEDAVWHPATATLVGKDAVSVWSDAVPAPVAVRYAWQNNPVDANVYNSDYLPASPFRTDDWPRKYRPPPAAQPAEQE
jgi:sialate O-acetylesterase